MAGLALVTAPTQEPVDVEEAKDHLRVTNDDEIALITGLVSAARKDLERWTGRLFITQTWDLILDGFPHVRHIQVPRPPLQSIVSVTYVPDGGVSTTFAASNYNVDTSGDPGRVVLKREQDWPTDILESANGVTVQFKGGYGDNPEDVPEPIRHAILVHLATLFEHREAVVAGGSVSHLPTVDRLLKPYTLLQMA